ncbi:glycosyltransferase [Salinicola sp. V024]|uniref:glycosyltransferase n=1 Tax=Salinicola sp. V024 TaxID=3459609 RepID=UPI00404479C4
MAIINFANNNPELFPEKVVDHDEGSYCIAFAFDYGYLNCFKTMIASLARNGAFLKNQVVVYTDDPLVLEDSFVKFVADKLILVKGEKKNILYDLAENNVRRPEKAGWNRGTFLKWAAFEEQDVKNLIFFDVDMICLQEMSGLTKLNESADFLCTPQFQRKLFPDADSDNLANLKKMVRGSYWGAHKSRVNSGVMILRQDLLRNDFFYDITKYVSERNEIHEQGHLSRFFSETNDFKRFMLPAAYNFQEIYLKLLDDSQQREVLSGIKMLHYAGGQKPWKFKPNYDTRISFLLWFYYSSCASAINVVG